jgi:hypothetical protein
MSNSEGEEWRPVKGYEGVYAVSNLGRLKRVDNGQDRILSLYRSDPNDRINYTFTNKGKRKTISFHRVVLEAFVGPCPKGMECAHLDGNPQNNRVSNLKWVTPKENNSHKWLHGTHIAGERNYASRFTEAQVYAMRLMYAYGARLCDIARIFGEKEMSPIHMILKERSWKHLDEPEARLVEQNIEYRERLNEAIKVLQFYANKENHIQEHGYDMLFSHVGIDGGEKARDFLGVE